MLRHFQELRLDHGDHGNSVASDLAEFVAKQEGAPGLNRRKWEAIDRHLTAVRDHLRQVHAVCESALEFDIAIRPGGVSTISDVGALIDSEVLDELWEDITETVYSAIVESTRR
jgi:hypothetical protein